MKQEIIKKISKTKRIVRFILKNDTSFELTVYWSEAIGRWVTIPE